MSKSSFVAVRQRRNLKYSIRRIGMPIMAIAMVGSLITGCSTINAIPVSRVPGEILAAERKDNFIDISMLRLRQDPP